MEKSDNVFAQNLPITSWAEDDRPREKLLAKGKHALSDAELLAIILGSGSRNETAVQLAQRLLLSVNNNLNDLARLSLADLMRFKGIGEAKAISVAAALEIGRRRKSEDMPRKNKISDSRTAFELLYEKLADLSHEEFWVLFLNRANVVLSIRQISSGGMSGTVVDAKIVFRMALEEKASAIILAHNHPSGNLKPSNEDIQLTRKLKDAGKVMDVSVLDHLILGNNAYFSFADEGML